jgi:hypothetical protein
MQGWEASYTSEKIMRKQLRRLVFLITVTLTALAVLDQLRRPQSERTWHGDVFGVPYDFRPPSLRRFRDAWWNPDDPRLFTPRDFGVGWALNLACLLKLAKGTTDDGGARIDNG